MEKCGGKKALEGKSTAQVCEEFVKPFTTTTSFSNQPKKVSYCELLQAEKHPAVGVATIFVSHAWKFVFLKVLEALSFHITHQLKLADPILWFDVFSNNQHLAPNLSFDWWCNTFKSAIREFGHTVLVLSPWKDPIPLTRAWCLFEIYCTADSHCQFTVAMSAADEEMFIADMRRSGISVVKEMMAKVDLNRSECYKPEDKDRIFEAVRRTIGFDGLNGIVFSALRNWMLGTATNAMEAVLGETEEKWALMIVLGTIHSSQGEYEPARALYAKCYANRLQKLGPSHADTLAAMNKLATVHREMGQSKQAEKLYAECYQLCKASLGEDHAETMAAMNMLAMMYNDSGRHKEALGMFQQCLAIKQLKLGANHASTVSTMNNLAMVYKGMNQFAEAERIYADCLEKCKATLGDDHPNTLSTMNNLAIVYRSLGKQDQAVELYRLCLAKKKVQLGEDHPETLSAMNNLAKVLVDMGQLFDAQTLLETCLKHRRTKLGETHPSTLSSMFHLAALYQQLHKLSEARAIFEDCLPKMAASLGEDHNETLATMGGLITIYEELGEVVKANEMKAALRKANHGSMVIPLIGGVVYRQRSHQAACCAIC